jgi:hypothetical protein
MTNHPELAQLISEMSLIVAVSNVYLAGRFQEIRESLEWSTSVGDPQKQEYRNKLIVNLFSSCIPALIVNAGAMFVFMQPVVTGDLNGSTCLWACDAFASAYVLLLGIFALLVIWSGWLSIATILQWCAMK